MNRDCGGFFQTVTGSVTSEVVIEFFNQFAAKHATRCEEEIRPCIVILDNASMHRSKAFKAQWDNWAAQGVLIHYLPTYSPKLNLIKVLWRRIKYNWLPLTAYKSVTRLKADLSAVLNGLSEKYRITFSYVLTPDLTISRLISGSLQLSLKEHS